MRLSVQLRRINAITCVYEDVTGHAKKTLHR